MRTFVDGKHAESLCWSWQERAYVAGLAAANLVLSQPGFLGQPATILDVEPDEPHIAAGKQLFKGVRQLVDGIGLNSPFL